MRCVPSKQCVRPDDKDNDRNENHDKHDNQDSYDDKDDESDGDVSPVSSALAQMINDLMQMPSLLQDHRHHHYVLVS